MRFRMVAYGIAVVALLSATVARAAIDYSRYKPGDLDEILSQPRPDTGVKLLGPQKLRLEITLDGHAGSCSTAFLKKAMVMLGAPKKAVDGAAISKCIKARSPTGRAATMYVQDAVAKSLAKEIPLGSTLIVFVDLLYVNKDGPGVLVNEFQARER